MNFRDPDAIFIVKVAKYEGCLKCDVWRKMDDDVRNKLS